MEQNSLRDSEITNRMLEDNTKMYKHNIKIMKIIINKNTDLQVRIEMKAKLIKYY